MPVSCVDLSKVKRRFHLPFPLESVGIIENHPYMSVVVKGKLELCVRLSADAEQSREWFDDTCYTVRYPNVALKVGCNALLHSGSPPGRILLQIRSCADGCHETCRFL